MQRGIRWSETVGEKGGQRDRRGSLLITNARVELELGPLTRVRRGESGLGDVGACALSGIVSALWSVSLVSESSSESGTKADSFGREDGKTGTLSF